MTFSLREVAGLLPDIPEWIEVRSMLLHRRARLSGQVGASPPTFVALHTDEDQAVVVGRAALAAIHEAASMAGEILAATEDQAWVAGALPDWKIESALLFRRATDAPSLKIAACDARFLEESELASIIDGPQSLVTTTLRDELRSAQAADIPIAAAFDAGRAAAFCYAGSVTETLWDVSIDTLEPYRRRGNAMKVVSFLIEHYQGLGKEPVWGALVSNPASTALAKRLGFVAAGSLSVFSAPRVVNT